MRFKVFGAALFAAGILAAPAAQAQTEIQWWHSMAGALSDRVNDSPPGSTPARRTTRSCPSSRAATPNR